MPTPAALLTDGALNNYAAGLASAMTIAVGTATFLDITFDLSVPRTVRHLVARFGSRGASATLPMGIQWAYSADNSTLIWLPRRPVGGAGDANTGPGDWDENLDGIAVEAAVCDVDVAARYWILRVYLPAAGTVAMDEAAIYGGGSAAVIGGNWFCGYLGDNIEIDPRGLVRLTATDALKKLADNNDVRLTAAYRQGPAVGSVPGGLVELADIVYGLLSSSAYWTGEAGSYSAPTPASLIGWAANTQLTGFGWPLWQGQSQSILGYCYELFHVIGWYFYADGSGIYRAEEPGYLQTAPDRVFAAGSDDGNGDVRECVRRRTGKEMRNRVQVTSGRAIDKGSGATLLFEPNSLRRYGPRTSLISDPIAITQPIRQKIGLAFLRDYAWRIKTLKATICPDFDTDLRQIHAFRAPARPNLYAKASSQSGHRRQRELWALQTLAETVALSEWSGEAEYVPFQPQSTLPPNLTSISPGTPSGGRANIGLNFTVITDPKVRFINLYVASAETGPYTLLTAVANTGQSVIQVNGQSTGAVEYWYLTSVDAFGVESMPSAALAALPGSVGDSASSYYVSDLTVGWVLTSGPDIQGVTTYQFYAQWTAPLSGLTQYYAHADVRNPAGAFDGSQMNQWQIYDPSMHWWAQNRIGSGRKWDRVTPGALDANWVIRTKTNLSGLTLYFRLWNSTSTQAQNWVPGNVTTVGIP